MSILDIPTRRISVFELSAAYLIEMLKPGRRCYEIAENALPADAKVIGAQYDVIRDVWEIGVESETFEPVPINELAPRLLPIIAHYVGPCQH